jgi:hypothetical protein
MTVTTAVGAAVSMVAAVRVMVVAVASRGNSLRPSREDQVAMRPAVRMTMDMTAVPMRNTRSRHMSEP